MLVLVIAPTNEEFRQLVLKDTADLGAGGAAFLKDEEREVNWRSSVDPEHRIRYVWAKDYQEARSSLDEDNFRILGRSSKRVEKKPVLSPELLLAISLAALAAGALLMQLR